MKNVFIVVVVIMILSGCSSNKNQDPFSELYDVAGDLQELGSPAVVVEAQAPRRDILRDKLEGLGQASLSSQLEAKVSKLQKGFIDEATDLDGSEVNETFMQVWKSISNNVLRGSSIFNKPMIIKEGDHYSGAAIMYLNPKIFNQSFNDSMHGHKEYTRWRSSEAFKELEKEEQKFDDYKAKNEGKW
ncbi:MAG: hypothetical protein K9N07_10190 [Candidatus Cloacimonetes bacterium]|nr:hypothetical protein [Candidatus Cloacimonadota bacterium]